MLREAYSTVSRAHIRQRSTRRHRRSAVPQIPPPSVSGELRTKWRGCVAGRPAVNVLYLSYLFLPIRRLTATSDTRTPRIRHLPESSNTTVSAVLPSVGRRRSLRRNRCRPLDSVVSPVGTRTADTVVCRHPPTSVRENSGQCGVGADIQNVQNRCK